MYLTSDCSPAVRRIIFEVVDLETEDDVKDAFERLRMTLDAEREANDAREREQRRREGTILLAPAGAAQQAVEDWNASILAARGETPVADVDDEDDDWDDDEDDID